MNEISRRSFIAGLMASFALVFAPWDRFMEGLRALFDGVFAMPMPKAASFKVLVDALKEIYSEEIYFQYRPSLFFRQALPRAY